MQIEKLSKELKELRKINPMSTDHSIRRCKQLQIYGPYLLVKELDRIKWRSCMRKEKYSERTMNINMTVTLMQLTI